MSLDGKICIQSTLSKTDTLGTSPKECLVADKQVKFGRYKPANQVRLRLCSHLVPEHGDRVRVSLGTNLNTPFIQVPTPEFGHGVLGHGQRVDILGTQCVNTAPFCAGAQALASARAPSVNIASETCPPYSGVRFENVDCISDQ